MNAYGACLIAMAFLERSKLGGLHDELACL